MDQVKNQHSLGSVLEQQSRLGRLNSPHIKPLSQYLENIRTQYPAKDIPHIDPNDGGINAKALFLMFAVGPKPMNSPFLSVDSTDVTAKNLRELLQNAKIARSEIVLWNIVPWYVGRDGDNKREVKERETVAGCEFLEELLPLLPQLKVIVLLGKQTHFYSSKIQQLSNLPIVETSHPGPQAFNCHPGNREKTQKKFLEVAHYINQ